MAYKDRSFIPPIDVEYNEETDSNDVVLWSLGTPENPWKNIYIRKVGSSIEETIDVYDRLSKTSDIPFDATRVPGSFLTCDDSEHKLLVWQPLDVATGMYVKGQTIVNILKGEGTPEYPLCVVPAAQADALGRVIDKTYLLSEKFKANEIIAELGVAPVNRATADKDGNEFSTMYVSQSTYAEGMANKIGRDEIRPGTAAYTNLYKDLDGLPQIIEPADVEAYVQGQLKYYTKKPNINENHGDYATETVHGSVKVLSGHGLVLENTINAQTGAVTSATLRVKEAKPAEEGTVSDPGTVKINSKNGLELSTSGIVSIALSDEGKPGTVAVTSGNGLTYSPATGQLMMAKASVDRAGSVKLGIINTYTSATVSIKDIPGDTQYYLWTGTINSITSTWIIKKLNYGTVSAPKYFVWAQDSNDPRMELHSNDNGTTWFAPYATWHA